MTTPAGPTTSSRTAPEGIYIQTTEGELLLPADGSLPRIPRPIGPHEIAEILGVSRQRVVQLRAREDFPKPWTTPATGNLWKDTEIEAYAAKRK